MHVRVRVKTGMKRETVMKLSPTQFEISVKEKPERNMANRRIQEILASYFGVLPGLIRLIAGHRLPSKTFSIPETLIN